MNLNFNDEADVRVVFVYPSGHTSIKFSDGARIEFPTEKLEKILSMYQEARNSTESIGVSVA